MKNGDAMRTLIAALLLGLLAGAVQGQQIYRWVDADGRVRYTAEKPPAGVQSKPLESRVQSYGGTPTVSQARQFFARGAWTVLARRGSRKC